MVIDDFMNKFTHQINLKNHFYHKQSFDFQRNLLYLDFLNNIKNSSDDFLVQLRFHAKKKEDRLLQRF